MPTKMQPASGFCALPGAFPSYRTGRLFAALIPPLPGFLPTPQHCNVYNFCNLAIFKSAIPRLQNSNTLHCCAVTFLRHCLILSSSQYHVLFIRFARTPNSFFAFSSVRFDIPCSSARLKISLLCMALFVSASSRSNRYACSLLFAFGAMPPNTSSAVMS